MEMRIEEILQKEILEKRDLVAMLSAEGEEKKHLFRHAEQVKLEYVGNKVYFRGLIEFSNICSKDCYYCGIRKGNKKVTRYNLSDEEILEAAQFAYENNYGSVVLQGGEIDSLKFTERIERLCREIKKLSDGGLGITLSLGEQSRDTYARWMEAGAHRYLLRIESSSRELFEKIHPHDEHHEFDRRYDCLRTLQELGYQAGTGVMIGLPFQSVEDLADDLLFMQSFDVDMVGMGPYIEHHDTPLYDFRDQLLPIGERFDLALKMIATLRILMKDINIAAATALQAIDPLGREKAVKIGANVIMPNVTPGLFRNDYALYENKPCTDEDPDQCKGCLDARLKLADGEIGYGEWGDSQHFLKRNKG
ncbi:MAG: [FeFe] hydrogenase H-cluster radical SAM maturase HydE [Bacteroidales bacterium]|nr:[FeFe] hydrogenase H-cluster radical SAM maturase HydE [Bacteroidales bacterium]